MVGLLAVQLDMRQVVATADIAPLVLLAHLAGMKAHGRREAPVDMDFLEAVEPGEDMAVGESRKKLLLQNTWIGRFHRSR